MSYCRSGYPLKYFKGFSDYYVYLSEEGMVDQEEKYEDTRGLVDLIGTIIERETSDRRYAWKIVRILAKKLGIEKDLRGRPLTEDDFFEEMQKLYGNK